MHRPILRASLALCLLSALPLEAYAADFSVVTIDRPTALPVGSPVLEASVTHSTGAANSTDLGMAITVGLTEAIGVGIGLPALSLQPETSFDTPSVFATYGWDIDDQWTLAPRVAIGLPLIAAEATTTLAGEAALSFTVNTWLEFGVVPAVSWAPATHAITIDAPAYAFFQLADRVFTQLDAGPAIAIEPSALELLYGLSLGYALGRSDVWVVDLVGLAQLRDALHTGADRVTYGAGLGVAGYWIR